MKRKVNLIHNLIFVIIVYDMFRMKIGQNSKALEMNILGNDN